MQHTLLQQKSDQEQDDTHTVVIKQLTHKLSMAQYLSLQKSSKHVMSSAVEVEVTALFINARAILPLQVTCKEQGQPQPVTPMRTDNSTASGIINGTFAQDRNKAMDMRF